MEIGPVATRRAFLLQADPQGETPLWLMECPTRVGRFPHIQHGEIVPASKKDGGGAEFTSRLKKLKLQAKGRKRTAP